MSAYTRTEVTRSLSDLGRTELPDFAYPRRAYIYNRWNSSPWGLGTIRNPRGAGIYFIEADAAAALQSPRMQPFSLRDSQQVRGSEKNPRLGNDQWTNCDMARAMKRKHNV